MYTPMFQDTDLSLLFEGTRSLPRCGPAGCLYHTPARATAEQRAGNLHRDHEPQAYSTVNKHTHKSPVPATTQPAGGLQWPHSNHERTCARVHTNQAHVLPPPTDTHPQSPCCKCNKKGLVKKFVSSVLLFPTSHPREQRFGNC